MKKNLNRIATLALSAMLVGGMAMPVLAYDTTIPKAIDMTSAINASVPHVSFKYTVTAMEEGNTINGKAGNTDVTIPVLVDSKGAVSIADLSFPTSETETNTGNVTITVDETKYDRAGVYGYVVKESSYITDANTAAIPDGMENAGEDIYLYVTVAHKDGGFEVKDVKYANKDKEKLEKFYDSTYTTYSLTIKKSVAGSMGDKSQKFSFNAGIKPKDNNVESYSYLEGNEAVTIDFGTNNKYGFELKDGESFTIFGLSAGDIAAVGEEFKANEGYVTSLGTVTGATAGDFTAAANGGGNVEITSFTADATLTITNKRETVTPTGIVMDIAPYVLMLGAAGGLGAAFMVKRRDDEE